MAVVAAVDRWVRTNAQEAGTTADLLIMSSVSAPPRDPVAPGPVAAPGDDLVAIARALLEPLWNGEELDAISRRAHELLDLARRLGDVPGECAALYVTLATAAVQGDAATVRVLSSTLQRTAQRAGLPAWESLGRARLARLHLSDGREDLALDEAVAAELLLDEVADDDASASAAYNGIASSYLRLGLFEDADRLFAQAAQTVAEGYHFAVAALAYNRMLTQATWAVGLLRSAQPHAARARIDAAATMSRREDLADAPMRRELGGLELFVDLMTQRCGHRAAEVVLGDLMRQRGVETDSYAYFALAHRAADDGELDTARRHVDAGLAAVHPIEGAAIHAGLRWQGARIAVLADPGHPGLRDVWEYAGHEAEQVWELRRRREEAVHDRLRIGRLRRDHERVSQAADEDPLTGLANRRRIDRDRDALQADRRDGWVTVAYLDLDGFKEVNDTHGHELGDRVLVEVARLLLEHTRETDLVGRYGGDEFVVVSRDTDRVAAEAMLERLLAAVRVHDWRALHPQLDIRLSVGAATGHGDHRTLFTCADDALYAAKRAGRDRGELVVVGPEGQP